MIKPENYYVVQGWMITDLKLSGISLQVYAIIYGFSMEGKSVFNGGHEYLAEWCNCSDKQITRVLSALLGKGLITKTITKVHNRNGFAYAVTGDKMSGDKMSSEKMSGDKMSDDGGQNVRCQGTKCPMTGDKMSTEAPSPSYSPADLPPAPYNKDIKNDIKKNKKEEDNARATAHSFSYQDTGKVIFTLPVTDGELTFTGEEVKDLQSAFVDLNILAELKQIALKVKTAKIELTADRARRYVTSWLTNSQNKRASSSNVWQSSSLQYMDPDDPKNPFTHPEYDKAGNKLDYDGNIIKTAQEIRAERKAEAERKEAERIADLDRRLSPEARAEIEACAAAERARAEQRRKEQEQAKKHPKKPYWEMTEDELKALLKPIKGEALWEYQVRTEKIKNQLLRLKKIKEQQEQEAVNA